MIKKNITSEKDFVDFIRKYYENPYLVFERILSEMKLKNKNKT